jgi:hypothetical protein
MTTYFLRHHVFGCIEDHYLVFLDVRKDAYSCVDEHVLHSLPITIAGLPRPTELSSEAPAVKHTARDTLNQLLTDEIITESAAEGKRFGSVVTSGVTSSLPDCTTVAAGIPRFREARRFFVSTLSATVQLKAGSFSGIIDRIQSRKRRRCSHSDSELSDIYTKQVAAFRRLRSIFPREHVCLFDSLALVDFLAYSNLFPQWVFGIRLSPFSAHCWVQVGETVLNDSVEGVAHFTPIMAI